MGRELGVISILSNPALLLIEALSGAIVAGCERTQLMVVKFKLRESAREKPHGDWSYVRRLQIFTLKKLLNPTKDWIIKGPVCFSKAWFSF